MRNVYEQYLPTREDIRAKELSGSQHHNERRRKPTMLVPKNKGYWRNNTMEQALDKVHI